MNRRSIGRAGLAVLAATTLLTVAPRPAGAFTSSCKIAEFPATQASQSALNYSCLFTNGLTTTNELSTSQTFHDFANVSWHRGASRKVTLTAATALNGTVITAAAGNFTAADINHAVSGVGIAPRAFIKTVTATTATLNVGNAAISPIATVVTVENSNVRAVKDAVNVTAATGLTSASANFNAGDAGKPVSGTNIKPGTTIATVTNATTVVLSQAGLACSGAADALPLYKCVSQVVTIGGVTNANTTARAITGTYAVAGTVITAATAGFAATDTGLPVAGVGLAPTAHITAVTATTATITPAATRGSAAAIAGSGTHTALSTIVTGWTGVGANALNTTYDVGDTVVGTGIPAGATIASIQSATAFTLSAAATTTGATALTVTPVNPRIIVGAPSATAPANGSAVMDLNVALALSPGLSAGAQSCAAAVPTGFALQGQWYNPGSFVKGGLIQAPTANARVVGQVVFTTLLQFAAYIVQTPTDTSIAAPHYDIVWPLLPTSLAKCPAPNTTPVLSSFTVNATVASQNALATGIGTPSTGQVRYLNPGPAVAGVIGSQTGLVAKLVDGNAVSATHTVWGPFTKTCSIQTGASAPSLAPAPVGLVTSCQIP